MKKILIFAMMLLVGLVLTGCTSLEDKALVLDSSVQGFKVTTGADTTSGTPLPNISAGWGSNLLITMPTDQKGTLEYEAESGSLFGSVFGIEVKDKTKVRITAGDSKVVVTTETNNGNEVTTEVGDGVVAVNVTDGVVVSTPQKRADPAAGDEASGTTGSTE